MIRFRRLRERPADWDTAIGRYRAKTLFHESAWLAHVLDIHPDGRMEYYEIVDGERRVGLHCALRVTRLLVPIQGSPLGGTGTNFMGPMVDAGIDQDAVLQALTRLFGPRHFLHLELSNPTLDADVMRRNGFNVDESVTHMIDVPGDPDAAFAALRSEARNRVRRAERHGVVVEQTSDPAAADEFHDQLGEVYGKQGMVRPFGPERPRSLFRRLHPAGRLLALRARRGDEVLATGLFPYDERCIYFWGAGSWLRYHQYSPNEALHWAVIQFAAERGIPRYNMCGGTSQFKNKFGGADVPYRIYHRSAMPLLQTARRLYRERHYRALHTAAPAATPAAPARRQPAVREPAP